MFYQSHSLTLYTVEVFNLAGLAVLGFILSYNGLELKKYLNYLTGTGLIL